MGETANKRVNIYIDQTAADAALVKLQGTADKLNKTIDAGRAAGKNMTAELKKLETVNSSIKSVQNQLDKGLAPSIAQQTTLVNKLRNEVKNFVGSSDDLKKVTSKFQEQNVLLQKMQANVNGVKESSQSLGTSFDRVFTRILQYAAGYAILNKITGFFKASVEEASNSEQALSKLKNILDNVGRSDAFDRLKNKATEMAERFKFIDNDDVIDVFQKLITYGKLTEKQINDLTPVIINFAAKSQISLQESTSVITKALEGNARALKEYGINMKDGATVTERMSIIMDELKPRVDGAADAFGKTFAGQLAITKQRMADLEEETGNKLIPILTRLLGVVNKVVGGFGNLSTLAGDIFKHGLLSGDAKFHKQAADAQQQAANESAASSLLTRTEGMTPEKQIAFLDSLNKSVTKYGVLLDDAKFRKSTKEIESYSNALAVATIARNKLQDDINASKGGLLGAGGDMGESKKIREVTDKLKGLREEVQRLITDLNKSGQNAPAALRPFIDNIQKLNAELSKLKEAHAAGVFDGKTLVNGKVLTEADFQNALDELQNKLKKGITDFRAAAAKMDPLNIPVTLVPHDGAAGGNDANNPLGIDTDAQPGGTSPINKSWAEENEKWINLTIQGVNDLMDILGQTSHLQEERDQRRIAQIDNQTSLELNKYRRLLNSKQISNQTYLQKEAELNARAEQQKEAIQKKAFERNKRLQIAQAFINGLAGEIKLWVDPGFPAAIPLALLLGAETLANVALIASQQFAEGGRILTDGKINATPNIPTQPNGDNVLATVKTGEVILNEQQQAALGGARTFASIGVPGFGPAYQNRPYMAVDTAGILQSYTRLRYAGGGLVQDNTAQQAQQSDAELKALMNAVLFRLENPIAPVINKIDIPLKQITDASDQKARILQNATLQ